MVDEDIMGRLHVLLPLADLVLRTSLEPCLGYRMAVAFPTVCCQRKKQKKQWIQSWGHVYNVAKSRQGPDSQGTGQLLNESLPAE